MKMLNHFTKKEGKSEYEYIRKREGQRCCFQQAARVARSGGR
jgi:hypothetical protein